MDTIIRTVTIDKKGRRQKRRRTSFLFCAAAVALAGSSVGLDVNAFGVATISTPTYTRTRSVSLGMQSGNKKSSSYRNAELVSRKAALIDTASSNTLSESTNANPNVNANANANANTNSDSKTGIRNRVNSFLRSKKDKRKSKVVEEVRDVDSFASLLGQEGYTAVIFHAPYCRACKASMPLFEELARQYNKRQTNQTYNKLTKKYTKQFQNQQKHKQPVTVKFLSVPVTQDNSKDLQERFAVTKFPLAHIYDPFGGLVDERPVLRKLFPKFEERLESVVVQNTALAPSDSRELELEPSSQLLETASSN